MKVSTDVTIATVLSYVFIYGLIWFHMLSFCFFKSVPGVVEHMVQGECSSEHQAHRAQKQRDVKYPRRLPFPKDLACAILNVFTCLQLIHFLDLQTWIPFAFKQSFLPLRLLRLLSLLCRLSSTPQGQNFYLSGTGINCSSTRMHARWNSLSISLSLSLSSCVKVLFDSLSLSLSPHRNPYSAVLYSITFQFLPSSSLFRHQNKCHYPGVNLQHSDAEQLHLF